MATETLPVRGKSAVLASQLEKPDLDNRSYRVIQLPNKLEALLVHDPDTDKASAALDVHVGSFSDSDDLQVCRDRVLKLSECTVLHSPI
jgi:insulysin